MPIDIEAAERFILANARLLERHRLAVLLHGASAEPVLDALRAYRNPDGGFGHALEPDVRSPESEATATLHALLVLAEIERLDDPMVVAAASWVATIAGPDGGVPFVLPSVTTYPHAPFIVPHSGGSFLTFALAAPLREAGSPDPWLDRASDWCWARLEQPDDLGAYGVRFAFDFLDTVPDESRAKAALERLGQLVEADGSIPVGGGAHDERLTVLRLSERRAGRSRALFTAEQIEADLDRLEAGQHDDGGWEFDWTHWSEGQSVESRGLVTLEALAKLHSHGRIELPRGT